MVPTIVELGEFGIGTAILGSNQWPLPCEATIMANGRATIIA